jgi:hypothetical protein
MIDIDTLTESELMDLNYRVCARIRLLREVRAHEQMLAFRVGDRVSFEGNRGERVAGVVTRYNRKTVTVITDTGRHWTVAPSLLQKGGPMDSGSGPIIDGEVIRSHQGR